MRAADMKERPSFELMKQTDVQNIYYMQMPRWLFSDPRYAELSLDAKVTYTFLLNRFQLSRRKGWVNDRGEVFVIFPRKELASELRVCEKRVTAAFRDLAQLQLIWEKRCGRGDANQIYLSKVEPMDDPHYQCAPFQDPRAEAEENNGDLRTAETAVLSESPGSQEPHIWQLKNSENCASRAADIALQEPPNPPPSNKEINNTYRSYMEVSQSVREPDARADEERELMEILDACELDSFPPETARVFENAVERLFYSDSFRVGNATLPRSRIRAKLRLLDGMILRDAERKLTSNTERQIKNSTQYTMAAVFNCIAESESDLMVDPYLNSLRAPPGRG